MNWDSHTRWRQGIERLLNHLGSQVQGNQRFEADRIADLVQQIEEVRAEVKTLSDRVENMAKWVKANVKKGD